MQNDITKRPGGWLGAVALVLLSATVSLAQRERSESLAQRERSERPAPLGAITDLGPKAKDYWLGLGCTPVDEAIRAQTDLPDEQGLLVEELVDGGPAAKAGVNKYDILVKADQKPLRKVEDLVQVVEASRGSKLTLEVLRKGRTVEVVVTPEKRPEDLYQRFGEGQHLGSETERMLEWLERMQPGTAGRPPMRFRFYHPGTILLPESGKREPMPEDMTVTVTKQGKEPAKITVRLGDKTWEVREGELDTLPTDIRPHVERMLSRLTKAQAEGDDAITFVPKILGPEGEKDGPGAATQGRLEKRLEDMNRRLDEMRNAIDELRGKSSTSETPGQGS